MRPSTIAKTFALFSGAVSVVARSLPAQRSEINIRAAGGQGFSNPLAILEGTDANVDNAVSKAASQAATSDVDDLPQPLKGIGLVKISEEMLDGGVYISTYSIPVNVTLSKRDTGLEKRTTNLSGARCVTRCGSSPVLHPPNLDSCRGLASTISNEFGKLTIFAHTVKFVRFNICATQFVNDLDESVIYDFNDFGGTVEWLSGECVERQGQNIGSCIFGSALANPAYIVVSDPRYFGQ